MKEHSNDKKQGHGMLVPVLFIITAIVSLVLLKLFIS
jgi:hypothetical protein